MFKMDAVDRDIFFVLVNLEPVPNRRERGLQRQADDLARRRWTSLMVRACRRLLYFVMAIRVFLRSAHGSYAARGS